MQLRRQSITARIQRPADFTFSFSLSPPLSHPAFTALLRRTKISVLPSINHAARLTKPSRPKHRVGPSKRSRT